MFSFQSNWKLSASILPRDERHKIAASARVIADKKRQARESPKYKSDRYLFSDFESREVSHPPCFKEEQCHFFFCG